jgi:amino acid transporter
MREEWAAAGHGKRILFGASALYWLAMVGLFVASLTSVRSSYDAGLALGFYFSPLLLAAVIRGAYVLLSRSRPRPRFRSWWLLVIGMALGIVATFQRAAEILAERAA